MQMTEAEYKELMAHFYFLKTCRNAGLFLFWKDSAY